MTINAWNTALLPRRLLLVAIGASILVHVLIADGWRPFGGGATVAPQLRAPLPPFQTPVFIQRANSTATRDRMTPLDLRTAMIGPGSVRFWLSIDLAGNVVDVAAIDADPSAAVVSMAREHFLATRFVPAEKDERPVQSRVLLELRYGN